MTLSILDHPLISYRYFFPRPCRFPDPFPIDCGDAVLGCSRHERDPAAMTVVHFHGNGETVEDYLDGFVSAITGMGLNLFLVEYRGYGMSTGTPSLGRMLGDVAAIIRAIGKPPEKLVLFGRSVGSIFAIHGAALFPSVAGLIIESGIADPLERLLMRIDPSEMGVAPEDLAKEVEARMDHRKKLSAFRGLTLVMHTRNDDLVDVSNAERLFAWAAGPKHIKIFERGYHNNILEVNRKEYFEQVAAFVGALPPAKAC